MSTNRIVRRSELVTVAEFDADHAEALNMNQDFDNAADERAELAACRAERVRTFAHPPTWPIDKAYARAYERHLAAHVEALALNNLLDDYAVKYDYSGIGNSYVVQGFIRDGFPRWSRPDLLHKAHAEALAENAKRDVDAQFARYIEALKPKPTPRNPYWAVNRVSHCNPTCCSCPPGTRVHRTDCPAGAGNTGTICASTDHRVSDLPAASQGVTWPLQMTSAEADLPLDFGDVTDPYDTYEVDSSGCFD